jgi:hypothetical protein
MRTQFGPRSGKLSVGSRFAVFALSGAVGLFAALGLTSSAEAGSADARGVELLADIDRADFDYYRQNVEPIFMRPRGYNTGDGAPACVSCHVWQTSLRFALEEPTETADGWGWTPGQSTLNYQVVTQLVNASDPAGSKLLTKPLAAQAGGEGHTGGTYWESTSDPEYQTVLEWIETLPPEFYTPPPVPELDFGFYRTCVQQMYDNPRYGQLSCRECHAGGFTGFAPRAANGTAWTEAEARRGFEAIQRLILPGNPVQSRWLLKPLHPDGGGTYTHNGVRRWPSRDDPEWQMMAAWVRGERTGADCSM